MELDIFVPALNLVIEYQGQQHYDWHFIFGNPSKQQSRDEDKRKVTPKLLKIIIIHPSTYPSLLYCIRLVKQLA